MSPATQPKGDHSRGVRIAFMLAGHLCVGLGILGFVLPVLPGTVFLIAAAFCYARGSVRFYHWLLHNTWLGPPVRDWEQHRAMTAQAKVIAITMLVLGVGVSIVFVAKVGWLRLALGGTALGVAVLIVLIKTRKQGAGRG